MALRARDFLGDRGEHFRQRPPFGEHPIHLRSGGADALKNGAMMPLFLALVALVVSAPLVLALVRANELFFVRVRDGNMRLVRGRVPPRLFDDVADVVRKPAVVRAELRAVNEGGRPRLYAEGELSPEHKQRLRNVIGAWSVQQIRNAPRGHR
jgi:hypothetical protein